MKPGPAMRHPWIVAGRRRAPPVATIPDRRTSSSASNSIARSMIPSTNGNSYKPSAKQLVISPPAPLVAKVPPSASRVAHSMSSSKLSQPMSRTSSFKACTFTRLRCGCKLINRIYYDRNDIHDLFLSRHFYCFPIPTTGPWVMYISSDFWQVGVKSLGICINVSLDRSRMAEISPERLRSSCRVQHRHTVRSSSRASI